MTDPTPSQPDQPIPSKELDMPRQDREITSPGAYTYDFLRRTAAGTGQPPHPRYRQDREAFAVDATADEMEYVRALHDLTCRQWLTPEHTAAFAAGELEVPGRANFAHRAVLVSVPDEAEGTEVAWVDEAWAGAVFYAACLGVVGRESCQDVTDEWPEHHAAQAFWWFETRAQLRALHDLVADLDQHDQWDWQGLHGLGRNVAGELGERRWRWIGPREQTHSLAVPARHLPALTHRLQNMATARAASPALTPGTGIRQRPAWQPDDAGLTADGTGLTATTGPTPSKPGRAW
jgi:hypothetical protein